MKCKKCGEEIANESKFCPFCGTKVTTINKSQRNVILAVLGVVVLALVIGIPINTDAKTMDNSTKVSEISSNVVAPSIAADKMYVLYAGLINPVSVSSIPDEDQLTVDFPGCQVTGSGANRVVLPPTHLIGQTVLATVSASNGTCNQSFRIKRVPDPTAYIGGNIWGGKHSKNELLSRPYLIAYMAEDFAYDVKWTVNSFRLTVISKGIEGAPTVCSGGEFDGSVIDAINNSGTGTVLVFSDIKVSSVVGERTLRDITIRIK